MVNKANAQSDPNPPLVYEIRIKGHLDRQWTAWFEGMTITWTDDETLLTGQVVDQAALYGLLRKVRDLGLPLLAVTQIQSGQSDSKS
jgi:hypothetical protein